LYYTGDVCFHDQTILRSARFEDVKADVLIMETTRGNREVPKDFTREKEIERLVAAIHAAEKRKGCVLIPSFALGRTQEILALLALLPSAVLILATIYMFGMENLEGAPRTFLESLQWASETLTTFWSAGTSIARCVNSARLIGPAIAGLLRPSLVDVNVVSAPAVAAQRGIVVEEATRAARSDYESFITLAVTTAKQERAVGGTVFHDGKPRILSIKGIKVDAEIMTGESWQDLASRGFADCEADALLGLVKVMVNTEIIPAMCLSNCPIHSDMQFA